MIIRANCKINIGLDIVSRREDGFHELSTIMYPVRGLYDILDIERTATSNVEFVGKGLIIDCDSEKNLCVKAYNLMHERYGVAGLKITLDKRIPFGAGLGGGSSDATAVIVAINSLFELSLSEQTLIDLASELGSDTAFFVRNTPQLCSGRGEIMQPIEMNLAGKYLVMIKPNEGVSTKQAYAGVKPAVPTTPLSELIAIPLAEWQGSIKNDFEPHIFEALPTLKAIKEELIKSGAKYAAMSGSGSTIFGIFDNKEQAKSEQLRSHSPYIFEL